MLTESDPFVSWADSTSVLAINKFLGKLFHELGDSLINQRLILEHLGHAPESTNWPNLLIMPIFILRIEQITQTMAFNQDIVGSVHVTLFIFTVSNATC